MITINCGDCGHEYEIEFPEPANCPDCGFGPEDCDHPISERRKGEPRASLGDSPERYERPDICGKCGEVF